MYVRLGVVFIILCVANVHGHGRMMDPPSRNAMWRLGFSNPINYNDNEVFCGGVGVQAANGYKCGVCGDNHDENQPRDHEGGGKFGNGIIGRRYAMGQDVEVDIELTTNHWGYFELKLCPLNHHGKIATQECMDQNPLPLTENLAETKYYVPIGTPKTANFTYKVTLPEGLTCSQCVVQWTYTTGNTWGKCDNGTEAIGCGPQETFRNCADIQIFSNAPTGWVPNAVDAPSAIYVLEKTRSGQNIKKPFIVRHQVCVPTEAYKEAPHMAEWCQTNCLRYPPNCPPEKCFCPTECKAIGRLAGVKGTDVYCHRNCLRYPSVCPEDECSCTSGQQTQESDGQVNEELESSLVQAPAESTDNDDDILYVGRESPVPWEEYKGNPVEIEPGILVL